MKLIFDLESNELLEKADSVWCICAKDEKGNTYSFDPAHIEEGIKLLSYADILIGHNIIDFDLRVLNKLYGFKTNAEIIDTLVCSRTIWPNLAELDFLFRARMKQQGVEFPTKLIGSHSLKAWGYRLGEFKGECTDFSTYSENMLEYCNQDVNVTSKLFNKIEQKNFCTEALQLEHKIHTALIEQEEKGFPFDVKKATELFGILAQRKEELHNALINTFEPTIIKLKTKTKVIPFNPASRQQIADRLKKKGWNPEVFTETGEVKVDETVLSTIDLVEAKMLSEYLMLNKRVGQIATGKQAWLKLEKGGIIHGSVNHMGAVTSRCTHNNPNMAQVPSVSSPYGIDCRSLFHAPVGYSLLGCDASGLELRCLAHYMARYDKGTYADTVVNGDIHTLNQKAAGLETRNQAKTFIYGFLYGAGDDKIGKIIGRGAKEGKKIKEAFLKKTPALKQLREAVKKTAETNKELKGLDGRVIPVRHAHAALNTLLQSAGAIICKTWYMYIYEEMLKQKIDGYIVAFIHDELQIVVKTDKAEALGKITKEAMKKVEKHFNFRCSLDSEFKTGNNWADTH